MTHRIGGGGGGGGGQKKKKKKDWIYNYFEKKGFHKK